MSEALADCLWPFERRDEVVHVVARAAGIARPAPPEWFAVLWEDVAPGRAPALGAPALVRVWPAGTTPGGLLAVVAHASGVVSVVAPDGARRAFPEAEVARFVAAAIRTPVEPGVDRALAGLALPSPRADVVRGALVGAALAGERAADGFRVRAASGSFAQALRRSGLVGRLALTAVAYAAQLALLVVAWRLVGQRATGGGGSALSLVVALAAFVVAHFVAAWSAGRVALDGGRFLRTRLMEGLLALDTEPLRAEGIGQLLGRVMETEAVESLALGGGLLTVAGVFELATGAVVVALGGRGALPLAVLSVVVGAGVVLGARFSRALRRWSALRIALTHDLVERMVGHRTLVAQQPPALRHRDEERALDEYAVAGRALDHAAAALAVVVPRGWLFAGLAALAPAVAAGAGTGALATALAGVVISYGALRKLAQAFPNLATAGVAWRQVAPLFAGADAAAAAPPSTVSIAPSSSAPLVVAREIGFRYPGRERPAIADCSFEIARGDRVLLEGASGGGKSTLATLIAGLRAPDVGALELDGVDQAALGLPRWRERAGVVPQFHENHVFSASVLFNLLMGRAWPPRREDITEAEVLCRELDLGGVLARMPSGLEQLVGESGWQLSHGERSRLFIARALLQRLDLRVLDESFAALDPETLERVLKCVLARAETLVVIAHP
ncbi:MAG TPA: ATP-binding cassette domain-containing protein [Polyangia bacterium]|nr:ATP-binding cassette domain-containing protein [Polyangia bacterium]